MQQQIRAFKSKREMVITDGIFLEKGASRYMYMGWIWCMNVHRLFHVI